MSDYLDETVMDYGRHYDDHNRFKHLAVDNTQHAALMPYLKNVLATLTLTLSLFSQAKADDEFSVALPECAAKLERRSAEADVVIVRSDCHLSLTSLGLLLETGLQGLFPQPPLPIRDLYLGRLMDYPEWSRALATAAEKSLSWNSKRGRPAKTAESDNQRIRLLLNGPAYPKSLLALFAKYQLAATISDVEKVLVFKAKDIWPDRTAIPKGISPEARLPVDAQIWLRLEPAPP